VASEAAVKALSLTQPWASLVAIGAKTYETMSWSTTYRGPLAIAAALKFPRDCQELVVLTQPFVSTLGTAGLDVPALKALCGHIIAVVDVVDCVRVQGYLPRSLELTPPGEHEESFGDYTAGRYAWALANLRRLPRPVPAKGALGIWTTLDEDARAVEEQLAQLKAAA
jgi:activating signal cointegrator 1